MGKNKTAQPGGVGVAGVAVVVVVVLLLLTGIGVGLYLSMQQPQLVDSALALVGVDGAKPSLGLGTTAPGLSPPNPTRPGPIGGGPGPIGGGPGHYVTVTDPDKDPPNDPSNRLANLAWVPVEKSTIKGCKVAVVGSIKDPASNEVYTQVLDSNKASDNRIYESAFKVEDTANPEATVYYLSQFPDSKLPCAASQDDRAKYKKFFKRGIDAGGRFVYDANADPATGHACELIRGRGAEEPTNRNVERLCSAEPRCAGYYMPTDANNQPMSSDSSAKFRPILASASPETCKVSWARLPIADLPKTADLCTRYMGDGVWFTAGDNKNNCVPSCIENGKGRRWTDLCTSTSNSGADSCLDGWQLSTTSTAAYSCVPVTESSCPIGWTHQKSSDYPHGVCRPPCVAANKSGSREDDGFCHYDEGKKWTCLPGTRPSYYGTGPWTHFCKPSPLDYPAVPIGTPTP